MARRTEPEFLATTDMDTQGRERLDQFMRALCGNPKIMCGILDTYDTCQRAVNDAREVEPDTVDQRSQAVRALGGLLEHNVDMDAQPDDETLGRMRADISKARKQEDHPEVRLIRLGTLANEVATWQTQHPDTVATSGPRGESNRQAA